MALADHVANAIFVARLNEFSDGSSPVTRVATIGPNLTDNNTVPSVSGLNGLAADFTSANTEYLSAADNAAFSMHAGADSQLSVLFKLKNKSAIHHIISKWNFASNNREYSFRYDSGTDRYMWISSGNGTDNLALPADTFGSPPGSPTEWALAVFKIINSTGIGYLGINGGAFDQQNSMAIFDGNSNFNIGALHYDSAYSDVIIGEVVILRGSTFSDEDFDELWDGGAYKPFAEWDGGGGGGQMTADEGGVLYMPVSTW